MHQDIVKYISLCLVLVCLTGVLFAAPVNLVPNSDSKKESPAAETPIAGKNVSDNTAGQKSPRKFFGPSRDAFIAVASRSQDVIEEPTAASDNEIAAEDFPEAPGDSLQVDTDEVLLPPADTLSSVADSIPRQPEDTVRKRLLDAPLHGKSNDSLVYIPGTKNLFSFGGGNIDYKDMKLKDADFIHLNTETKLIRATGVYDTIKNTEEVTYSRFTFVQNRDEFEMDSILYNMATRKARIHGVFTREGEGILKGGVIKKMPDNVIHMKNGRYTTCDATCPHFYIQMTKATVVPNKKTIFGPAYLNFEGVPLYLLGLPFGFFPQKTERNSGFIFPEVGEEVTRGFFLRDAGYYFVVGDHIDVTALGGLYTLGSWEGSLSSNYKKRYRYSGGLTFDYAKDIIGARGEPDYMNTANMRIGWIHQQDPKANPSAQFASSVNYSTTSFDKYNARNINDYLSSQVTSRVSFSKNWIGKPYSFNSSADLTQNRRDSSFSLSLPAFSFNVQRINPFKRKMPQGREKWYEKINFTYGNQFWNAVQAREYELFKKEMFEKMDFGMTHTIPVQASFNLLQYLNITPNVNYSENWYFRKIEQGFNPVTKRVEIEDTVRGFYRVYRYNAGISSTTKLYGMYVLGTKRAIESNRAVFLRHVMSPRVGFSVAPGFDQYWNVVQTSDSTAGFYSPFSRERGGVPGREPSASIDFGISNTLEMKVPSERDTTGHRKLSILDAFNISSSYNFVADSLKLLPFSLNARATVIKGLSINASAILDPYQIDRNERRINKYMVSDGRLARLTSMNFSFSYGFQSPASRNNRNVSAVNNPANNLNSLTQAELQNESFFNQDREMDQVARAQLLATQYYDFSIPWSVSTSYNFSYSKPGWRANIIQTINFNGSISLTPKWGASFGAGYDFKMKRLTPGTVQISRDLHCFQLNFTWVPVGFRQSWSFNLRAKSAMLADVLRWRKSRSFLDNYYGF